MAKATRTPHFTPELFRFLRALKRNNDREWFQKNKARYIEHVRDPILNFIEDFAPRLKRISRHLVADASPVGGSMFRIHRDIRFSKDKRPYKTAATARFPHRVGKTGCGPGYYIHLGADGVYAAAGIWHPDTESLRKIREYLVNTTAAWKRLMSSAPFKEGTLKLEGESLKRAPRGIDSDHPLIEDLKRKDFVTTTKLDEKTACSPGFLDTYTAACRAAAPFCRQLARAVNVEW